MDKFEIKILADMICFKLKKAGITWQKRYTNTDSKKTYCRTKLYNFDLEKFLESDLPAYLKRKKIKYKLVLADRNKFIIKNSIAFYFYF